jgi:hypothetical protein
MDMVSVQTILVLRHHVKVPVLDALFVQSLGNGTGGRKVVGNVVKPAHDFSLPKIRRFIEYTLANRGR